MAAQKKLKNSKVIVSTDSKKIRDIYYDNKNKKAIYGTATPKEREKLNDEGIDLISIPWVSKDN